LLGVGLSASGLLLLWFRYLEPIQSQVRWSGRVSKDIKSLVYKRPPELSKGQWEFIVGWTINMHANCGSIPGKVEPAWRDEFAAELKRRLQGPISLADIDWIWDEYVRHTTYGQTFRIGGVRRGRSSSSRPTRDALASRWNEAMLDLQCSVPGPTITGAALCP
jgi:hypothetical protein